MYSGDMRQDAVQFIQTVVADDDSALAADAVLNRHLGSQSIRQVLLKFAHVRVLGLTGRFFLSRSMIKHSPNKRFGLTNRETLCGHEYSNLSLLFARL